MSIQDVANSVQRYEPPPPPPPQVDDEAGNTGSGIQTSSGSAPEAPSGEAPSSASGATESFVTDTINGLDSDGDSAVLELRAEVKAEAGVGVKAQYGYQVNVQQVGGDQPDGTPGDTDPSYEVTFDKKLLGALTGNVPFPGLDPTGELGLRTADSVTMSFDSAEDAARAVNILGRVSAQETLNDTASATSPMPSTGSGPVGNPVLDDPDTSSATGFGTTSPGALIVEYAADSVGPSAQDMDFLQDNITRYSTQLDARARLALEGSLANFSLEGRLDQITGVRRTVELPQDGQEGSVTYTLINEQQLTSKQRVVLGGQLADQFEAGFRPTNRSEHAIANTELDLTWSFDAADAGEVINGRIYPELTAASNGDLRAPDEMTMRMSFGHQDQNPLDLSRTDWVRDAIEVQVQQPTETAGVVLGQVLDGNLEGARQSMGENFTMTVTREEIQRDGFNVQPEIVAKGFDVFSAQASLIVQAGTDDVQARQQVTFGGEGEVTPPPEEPDNQLVVLPRDGLNVRSEAGTDAGIDGVLYHGTFIEATGDVATDDNGRTWVEVTGGDVNNEQVTGWVAADHVALHAGGAMNEDGGRINPELERQGYVAYEVQEGDNIWDIAHAQGVDFEDTLALNSGHLIDESLIFEGDTVYLPMRDPDAVPAEPDPVEPEQPSDSTGSTGESGSTGSSDSSDSTGSSDSSDSTGSTESGEPSDSTGSSEPDAPSDSTGSTESEEPSDSSGSTETDEPPDSSGSTETGEPADTGSAETDEPTDSGSGSGSGSEPVTPTEPSEPATPTPVDGRADLDEILREYQVEEEALVNYTPTARVGAGPLGVDIPIPGAPTIEATESEAEVLDSLGVFELNDFKNLASPGDGEAYRVANEHYPPGEDSFYGQNDGHNDAFRHAYVSARLTQMFGAEKAEALMTAHEARPNNPGEREAMDLYNNELGRRIASENPDASSEEIATLIYEAVENGEAVVVNSGGDLSWSDQVGFHEHGIVPEVGQGGDTLPGNIDAGELVESGS